MRFNTYEILRVWLGLNKVFSATGCEFWESLLRQSVDQLH
jgi:hypothetical protein